MNNCGLLNLTNGFTVRRIRPLCHATIIGNLHHPAIRRMSHLNLSALFPWMAFRKAIIHVHVAAVSDVHRFPANHHDFSPRVIASMYASMSAMLRAISHDFSVFRICGFQCRWLASNQRPPRLQLGALAN